MLEIKHTLCPSCSVGCGLNVVLNDGEIVGTFPYKRHPVNAGKNCLNGRNSIDCYLNKFGDVDVSKLISEVSKELDGVEASDVTLLCSGNNSLEEIEAIAKFGESKNYNVAFYADNLKNFSDVASYDDIAGANKVFVIGDILYENPLIGRRIVHAKQNGAEIYALGKTEKSVTFSIADKTYNTSIDEFLSSCEINNSSVVVFNYVDSQDDLIKIEKLDCKVLPVFSKSNSKGALDIIDAKSLDEMIDMFENTQVLVVFDDDVTCEFDFDFTKLSKIITFASCENNTTKMSDITVPIKTWLEKDGSFVNSMGDVQTFSTIVDSDELGIIEIIDKLN